MRWRSRGSVAARVAAVRAQVAVRRRVHVAVAGAARRDVDGLLALLLDGERDVEHRVVVRQFESKALSDPEQTNFLKTFV